MILTMNFITIFLNFTMLLNTELKLPSKLKWLVLAQLLLTSFAISFVIALFGGRSAGVSVFIFFAILIGLPIWLYKVIAFKCVSFTVTDGTLTINSGILIKRSNATSFAQIQNSRIPKALWRQCLAFRN